MEQKPQIPTLKDSSKPQMKIRGLASAATLLDRFKQFKKKDLAFIMAGLGTLFMAPLAEHFMMSPESADGQLQQGWGGRGAGAGGGAGLFGSGASPYEPGTTGLAPGGAVGGGSDIITPLNVRDPSALVMGPGATQQPPTSSAAPQTPPASSRSDADLKDALAASSRGIGGAARRAMMPLPKLSLGGSGLRGLGVASGGSSAGAGLGPVSAANVPSRGTTGGGLSPVTAAPGYRGTAGARGLTQGSNNIDALKKAAADAGNLMNRGPASAAADAAAAQAIPSGGAGFGGMGQGGAGPNDKFPGAGGDKSSKSVGESLAFLEKKMRMEKNLELEYKKKEANDFGLQFAMARNDALKSLFTKGLIDPMGAGMADLVTGVMKPESDGVAVIMCKQSPNDGVLYVSDGYKTDHSGNLFLKDNLVTGYSGCIQGKRPKGDDKGPEKTPPPAVQSAPAPLGTASGADVPSLKEVDEACQWVSSQLGGQLKDTVRTSLKAMQANLAKVAGARMLLTGAVAKDCPTGGDAPAIIYAQKQTGDDLSSAAKDVLLPKVNAVDATALDSAKSKVEDARKNFQIAADKLAKVPGLTDGVSFTVDSSIANDADKQYPDNVKISARALEDTKKLYQDRNTLQKGLEEPLKNSESVVGSGQNSLATFSKVTTRNAEYAKLGELATGKSAEFEPALSLPALPALPAADAKGDGSNPSTQPSETAQKSIQAASDAITNAAPVAGGKKDGSAPNTQLQQAAKDTGAMQQYESNVLLTIGEKLPK